MKKEFEVFAFSSPFYDEESYKDFVECGFTMPFLDWNEGEPGTDAFDRVMDYCDKYHLKALPMLLNGLRKMPDEEKIQLKAHPSFYGLHVWDEPQNSKDFDQISEMLKEFKHVYGNEYCFFVNLAPNCQLEFCKYSGLDGYIGVREYIDYYCTHVLDLVEGRKIFSFDFYPICARLGNNWLKREWLKHLEIFGATAAKKDYEFFVYLASVGGWHDDPSAEAIGLQSVEIKDTEYLRLQGFIDMCYGATGIGFFTYKDQLNFDYPALVGRKEKHPLYYDSKVAISDFKYLAKQLENFRWTCSNTYVGEDHTDYAEEAFAMLENNKNVFKNLKIVTTEKDLVVGEFVNEEKGEYAYLFMTYRYPENVGANKVSLVFGEKKTVEIFDVVNRLNEIVFEKTYSLRLNECQAKLIICKG